MRQEPTSGWFASELVRDTWGNETALFPGHFCGSDIQQGDFRTGWTFLLCTEALCACWHVGFNLVVFAASWY